MRYLCHSNAEKAGEAGWQPGDPILTAEEIAALQAALGPTPEPSAPTSPPSESAATVEAEATQNKEFGKLGMEFLRHKT